MTAPISIQTTAELKAHLLAGHPVTGAYSADDATAANECNEKNMPIPVTRAMIKSYWRLVGVWEALIDGRTQEPTTEVRRSCIALVDAVNDSEQGSFDLDDPLVAAVVTGHLTRVTAAGYMKPEEEQQTLKLGDNQRSILEVGGWRGGRVSADDIARARAS